MAPIPPWKKHAKQPLLGKTESNTLGDIYGTRAWTEMLQARGLVESDITTVMYMPSLKGFYDQSVPWVLEMLDLVAEIKAVWKHTVKNIPDQVILDRLSYYARTEITPSTSMMWITKITGRSTTWEQLTNEDRLKILSVRRFVSKEKDEDDVHDTPDESEDDDLFSD